MKDDKFERLTNALDEAIRILKEPAKDDPFGDLPREFQIMFNPEDNLLQLIKLRDAWRQDWNPIAGEAKYCIQYYFKESRWIVISWHEVGHSAISFPTQKKAQRFLELFEDLINECKRFLT